MFIQEQKYLYQNKALGGIVKPETKMETWFEVSVKYAKMGEDGREKKVSETYLLDAVSFTEAEARIHTELLKLVSGEFLVKKIVRTTLSEVIPSILGDRWFKGKVTFVTFDEESGKEKRVSQLVLVYAFSVVDSYEKISEAMHGSMGDFETVAISESPIIDVFKYEFPDI